MVGCWYLLASTTMTIVAIRYSKADATCRDDQSKEITRSRDNELPKKFRQDGAMRERQAPTRYRGATTFRGSGTFDLLRCGRASLLDAELLHT